MLGGTSFDGVLGCGEREASEPDDDPTDSKDGVRRSRRRVEGETAAGAVRKLRKGAKCSSSSDSSMRRS